jgi:DNA polymerase II small subunit/DNA polymerase delta subunit B
MAIDFEKDQQDAMRKTDNIQSLADQVEKLESLQNRLELQEENMKNLKSEIQKVSGDIIPTMMSEMGLAEIKLQDGSHLKVSTSYRATITEANKEAAFNWLRNNGLGDIIRKEETLKALVRERIEAGKDMPTEIFGVFSENKTTIKRNK